MTTFAAEDIPANHSDPAPEPEQDYGYLFEAPDYSSFLKTPTTATARDYQKKTEAMLKGWLWGAIHAGQMPDAATILEKGPGLAAATGKLADASPKVAKMLDLITAPESPVVVFAMTALAFGAQIARNHEPQISQVPESFRERRAARKAAKRNPPAQDTKPKEPLFTIRILGRRIPVGAKFNLSRIPFRIVLSPARAQTVHPGLLVRRVFSDSRVQKALEKEGLYFKIADDPENPEQG